MPRSVDISVEVTADHAHTAAAAAELFTRAAETAVAARGQARIAISGGSTPKAMFRLLCGAPFAERVPWSKLQLFWVDERCVGPTDPDSNYGMTRQAMLDCVPLPAAQIHRMEGELDPDEAAARYEAEIRNTFKLEGAETPTFDLVLLGLGPDGHTASLFPHTEALHNLTNIVVANHVPQKETWRLTLTWPVITQARQVAFLIEGEEKADMIKTVWAGKYDPESWPAQLIRPASGKLTLLLDQAAATAFPAGTTSLHLN